MLTSAHVPETHVPETSNLAVYPSGNEKTGIMVAVYLPIDATCRVHGQCPLMDRGCYAQQHHVGETQERAMRVHAPKSCCEIVRKAADAIVVMAITGRSPSGRRVPQGTPVRWAVSGDVGCAACARHVARAARVWRRRMNGQLYGYTHAWRIVPRRLFGSAVILASVESEAQGAEARAAGYRPAIVVPTHATQRASVGIAGRVTPCPQQTRGVSCIDCGLCFSSADTGVSFAAHGGAKKRALTVLQ